jgi:hypothetical protein
MDDHSVGYRVGREAALPLCVSSGTDHGIWDRRRPALLAELFAQLLVRVRSGRQPPLGDGDDRLTVKGRAP